MKLRFLSLFLIVFLQNMQGQFIIDSLIATDNLKLGQCYARCVLIRDTTLAKQIKVKYIEPQYDTIVEQVELYPAYSYYTLRQNAVVKPLVEGEIVSIVPPTIEISSRQIKSVDGYAKEVKKYTNEDRLGINSSVCAVFCIVEVPAKYRTFYYNKVVEPAKIIRKRGNSTVVEVIKDTSNLLINVEVPPQYFKVKRLVKRVFSKIHVESTFDVHSLLSEWKEVECGDVEGTSIVRKIQAALNEKGYGKLVEDDILGPETKKAFLKFQKDFNLPMGTLNVKSLEALGIEHYFYKAPFSSN